MFIVKLYLVVPGKSMESTYVFKETHVITQVLGLGEPMMEGRTTGDFKTLEILKVKELPILSSLRPLILRP